MYVAFMVSKSFLVVDGALEGRFPREVALRYYGCSSVTSSHTSCLSKKQQLILSCPPLNTYCFKGVSGYQAYGFLFSTVKKKGGGGNVLDYGNFFIFIAVFTFIVIVHEMGHFIMARILGVDVEIFSIGLGPKVIGFTKNRTLYQLAAIPLGGYVKLAGTDPEDNAPDASKSQFVAKSAWQRALIVFGGPATNILATLAVFYGAATIVGESMPTRKVAYVNASSPAGIGGVKPGDIITAIDKKPMAAWADVKKAIVESKGRMLVITIHRANHEIDLPITPIFKKYRVSMTKTVQEYQVGIKVASMYSPLSPDEAIIMAGRKMIQLSFTMIKSLRLLLSGHPLKGLSREKTPPRSKKSTF